MAVIQRNPALGLIGHSDRGAQYASSEHQNLLAKHGLVGSMSRKGNCWTDLGFCHNAVMERFFLNLKMERVWHKDYANHAEATNGIADYIQNLAIFHPTLSSANRLQKNLSTCLKLLDHYSRQRADFGRANVSSVEHFQQTI